MADSHTLQESQNSSMFLASQNKIRDTVKENLEKIIGYKELLSDVVKLCVHMFETKMYLTPTEKHMLVKTIVGEESYGANQVWKAMKHQGIVTLTVRRVTVDLSI
ncbi:cytoplasmic FMR1-interacting protein-like isoform X1 [Bemisia tabaci]|uniref:cytoplasmic FMR1-interacting protein-like isoform X1 n=1 Tax=Bemisia tabaci TaxID=7038 RepID=UPI003B282A33